MPGLPLAYLRDRALTTVLNILLLAISVALLVLLLQFGAQLAERMTRDAARVDLVVGAKGSPLQLILSSIYHIDQPTGNIPFGSIAMLRGHPGVRDVTPLALGDNFNGYRIVGTDAGMLARYEAHIAQGRSFRAPAEAVLGASVARKTGATIGQKFVGSHGLGEGHGHDHAPFTTVGILAPTGTVIDRLILTSVESVWDVHGIDHDTHGADADRDGEENLHGDAHGELKPEVTALLVTYRNAAAAISLPATLNRQTSLQAASPAAESARLLSLFGAGIEGAELFAWMLALTGGLAIFVALLNMARSREGDLALLRVMGARRVQVFATILMEGLVTAGLGGGLGLLLAHLLIAVAGRSFPTVADLGVVADLFLPGEAGIVLAVLVIGAVAAVIPALRVYRMNLAHLLANN
jgi:putative ABC transport system permease protein